MTRPATRASARRFIKVEQTFFTVEDVKHFRLCLNWKVLLGLAIVAVGIYFAVSPSALKAALPLLLVAACPLSMMLMMRAMPRGSHAVQPERAPQSEGVPAPVAVLATPSVRE